MSKLVGTRGREVLRGHLLYRKRVSGSWKVCAEFASSTSPALGMRSSVLKWKTSARSNS